MIKFFRRIRKKLIDESNLKRYLIYAIGEILLVVAGILIALQINNWNEENKRFENSREILREIKRNVISNSQQFREELEYEFQVISSNDIITRNLTETKIFNDTLGIHFNLCIHWASSSWESSGYETLKSKGVDLIKSEQLRESIINLYEITYPEIAEIIRTSEGIFFSTVMPIHSQLLGLEPRDFSQTTFNRGAVPFDYDALVQSNEFIGALKYWRGFRIHAIQVRQNAVKKNELLIGLINEELNQ